MNIFSVIRKGRREKRTWDLRGVLELRDPPTLALWVVEGTHAHDRLPRVFGVKGRGGGGEEPLEEGIASHSSFLVWRIPWTEEPGRLQSIELQRVGDDRSDSLLGPDAVILVF